MDREINGLLNEKAQSLTDFIIRDLEWEYGLEPGSNCVKCWLAKGADRAICERIASGIFTNGIPGLGRRLSFAASKFKQDIDDKAFNYASLISALDAMGIPQNDITTIVVYHLMKIESR